MKLLWTIRMAYWIKWAGYEKTWMGALQAAREECFQQFREDYSPKEAIMEDLRHGL